MKGPHMAGQHADSAAGYCASKTLSYSENIMIHLHIFNSRPYSHTHASRGAHIKKTHLTCLRSQRQEPWRAVRSAKMLVGAQSNTNNICTSSTARGGLLINAAANLKPTNPRRFPSFLSSARWRFTSIMPKEIHKCFSLPLSTTFSVTGGNKKELSMGVQVFEVRSLGGQRFYANMHAHILALLSILSTYIVSLTSWLDMTAWQHSALPRPLPHFNLTSAPLDKNSFVDSCGLASVAIIGHLLGSEAIWTPRKNPL